MTAQELPEKKQRTGFRGPSPDVGKPYQWKKGQSGNPGGRPKSKTLSAAYRNKLEEPVPNEYGHVVVPDGPGLGIRVTEHSVRANARIIAEA